MIPLRKFNDQQKQLYSQFAAFVPDGPLRTGVTWEYILTLGTSEARRMRRCRGCKYLGVAGHTAYCSYYLQTGTRRPCKFGEDCPVKELVAGVTIPDSHEEFIRQCDALDKLEKLQAQKQAKRQEEQNRKKLTFMRQIQNAINAYEKIHGAEDRHNVVKQDDQLVKGENLTAGANERTTPVTPPGRRATWDRDYAKMLWMSGDYYVYEIAEIVGTRTDTLWTYISRHGWRDLERGDVKPHRHILEEERALYHKYLKAKEEAGLI